MPATSEGQEDVYWALVTGTLRFAGHYSRPMTMSLVLSDRSWLAVENGLV